MIIMSNECTAKFLYDWLFLPKNYVFTNGMMSKVDLINLLSLDNWKEFYMKSNIEFVTYINEDGFNYPLIDLSYNNIKIRIHKSHNTLEELNEKLQKNRNLITDINNEEPYLIINDRKVCPSVPEKYRDSQSIFDNKILLNKFYNLNMNKLILTDNSKYKTYDNVLFLKNTHPTYILHNISKDIFKKFLNLI